MGRGGRGGRGGGGGAWRGGGGRGGGDPRGWPGVLVMCDQGREQRALAATGDVLLEYARKLYPQLWSGESSATAGGAPSAENGGASDASAAASLAGPGGGSGSIADELAAELAMVTGKAAPTSAAAAAAAGRKRPRAEEDDSESAAGGDGDADSAASERAPPRLPAGGSKPGAKGPVRVQFLEVGRALGLVWLTVSSSALGGGKGNMAPTASADSSAAGSVDQSALPDAPAATPSDPTAAASSSSSAAASADAAPAHQPQQPHPIDAVALVNAVMADVASGALPVVRNVMRLVPLQSIVAGYDRDVLAEMRALAAARFPRPDPPRTVTWAAEFRSRNNATVDKGEMLRCAGLCLPGSVRVDLANPEVLLVLEVFTAYAGLSVVPAAAYNAFKRYNLRLVAESDEERQARLAAMADAQAKGEERKRAKLQEAEAGGAGASSTAATSGDQPAAAAAPAAPAVADAAAAAASAGGDDSSDDEEDGEGGGGGAVLMFASSKRRAAPAATSAAAAPAPAAAAPQPQPTVTHDAAARRFEARVPGVDGVAAYLAYELVADPQAPAGPQLADLQHTFTQPAARGKGLAAAVTAAALAWAKQAGLAVVPSCSYISEAYLPKAAAGGGGGDLPAVRHLPK